MFYSLSATWIILGIFSKPAQRIAGISVALTAKCSMWTGMDGILAAARGRGDAFPAAPGLAPLVLGSGSMVVLWSPRTEHPSHRPAPSSAVILRAQQHQGAFLGRGKLYPPHSLIKCRSSSGQKPSQQAQPFEGRLRLLGD